MEFLVDPKFSLSLYKLLSFQNRAVINVLLIHDFVICSRVHLNIVRLYHHLCQIPIELSLFADIFNYFVASYLKTIVDKSLYIYDRCYPLCCNYSIRDELVREIVERLYHYFPYSFWDMDVTDYIKSISVKIPDKSTVNKPSSVPTSNNNECSVKKQHCSSDNDFQSVLLPDEQDHVKLCKDYVHLKSVNDVSESENNYLQENAINYDENKSKKYMVNTQAQVYAFSKSLITSKNAFTKVLSSSQSHCVSDMHCMQESDNSVCEIICFGNEHDDLLTNEGKQLGSVREEKNSNSVIFSETSFSRTDLKEKYIPNFDNDSDSDESIVFSEIHDSKSYLKDKFESNIYDSDSDDSVVFSENLDNESYLKDEFESNGCNSDSDDSVIFSESFNMPEDNGVGITAADFFSNEINFNDDANSFNENGWKWSDKDDSDFLGTINFTRSSSLENSGYINPCFEYDDLLDCNPMKRINDEWNNAMKDISSEPREPKKVSFVPLPHLASIQIFEPDNDGYCYSLHLLDQVRFQNRIKEFEVILSPYLTSEHRAKIYHQKYYCEYSV